MAKSTQLMLVQLVQILQGELKVGVASPGANAAPGLRRLIHATHPCPALYPSLTLAPPYLRPRPHPRPALALALASPAPSHLPRISQLPACLRAVGFLRRINALSDQELRFTFLQARDAYLQSQLAVLPTTDPFVFVRLSLPVCSHLAHARSLTSRHARGGAFLRAKGQAVHRHVPRPAL